jgi:hypothetical protein
MGRTIHDQAAEDELADMLAHPDQARDLHSMASRLRARDCGSWLVSAIGQTREDPAYWPTHQVAAFTSVVSRLASGKVARRRIPIGTTPGPDADRVGNAARLRHLPAPFVARLDMTQNGADSDGALEWVEPVTTWRSTAVQVLHVHALHGAVQAPFEIRPLSVPLEVGYTLPSRTFMHLFMDGAVARWAYDCREIHLLVDLERIGSFRGTRPLPADVEPVQTL